MKTLFSVLTLTFLLFLAPVASAQCVVSDISENPARWAACQQQQEAIRQQAQIAQQLEETNRILREQQEQANLAACGFPSCPLGPTRTTPVVPVVVTPVTPVYAPSEGTIAYERYLQSHLVQYTNWLANPVGPAPVLLDPDQFAQQREADRIRQRQEIAALKARAKADREFVKRSREARKKADKAAQKAARDFAKHHPTKIQTVKIMFYNPQSPPHSYYYVTCTKQYDGSTYCPKQPAPFVVAPGR